MELGDLSFEDRRQSELTQYWTRCRDVACGGVLVISTCVILEHAFHVLISLSIITETEQVVVVRQTLNQQAY